MRIPITVLFVLVFTVNVCAQPEISAPSAVVMDPGTGVVIFERAGDERNYPASTTKIMTALLALENGELNDRVYFSHEAVYSIEPGSSNIAMNADETLSLNDALYGLMLSSANEVANAIAEHISGSMEEFAEAMTARAIEIGTFDTSFKNAHGLPDYGHYTTAYDMALIMREAIKYPKFVELISTRTHQILPTELQPQIRNLNNTNRMIQPHTSYYNELVVGSKTGYTDAARHTLVTYARQGEAELIISVMRVPEVGMPYTDTSALMEYGFSQYSDMTIFDPSEYKGEVSVRDGASDVVAVEATESVTRYLPRQASWYITTEASLKDYVTAPVYAGETLGELRVYCNGVLEAELELTAAETVLSPPPVEEPEVPAPDPLPIHMIISGAVIVLCLILLKALSGWHVLRR